LTEAKEYIRRKYAKPGEVYLGIVSRLDAPVTGVVIIARTSKAAARLTEMFKRRDVEKTYWALVEGRVDPASATLVHYVRKDERHRKVLVVGSQSHGAQRAELAYHVLRPGMETGRHGDSETRRLGDLENSGIAFSPCLPRSLSPCPVGLNLLEVELLTGRKHQIRVQLADVGWPVVGDRKYGSRRAFPDGIALHSRRLVFEHPVKKSPIEIDAPLPAAWEVFR
jgi:23S rRNA pseudouridine1911/1915/1917 synthase